MQDFTGFALDELEIGQSAEEVKTVTEADLEAFAEVSGDRNPVHMDEAFARATPFRGRIAHGALVASYISGVLGNQLPGPGAIFIGLNLKFMRPVRIGDTVTARATVKSIDPKTRRVFMDCVCLVEGEAAMEAEAEIMIRKRRKKTSD